MNGKTMLTVIVTLSVVFSFVPSVFSTSISGGLDSQFEQIINTLKDSDKKIKTPISLSVISLSSRNFAIGVRNLDDELLLYKINLTQSNDYGTFLWNTRQQSLGSQEIEVFPLRFTSNGLKGSFDLPITIINTETNVTYAEGIIAFNVVNEAEHTLHETANKATIPKSNYWVHVLILVLILAVSIYLLKFKKGKVVKR